jgi:hypothetical protein
MQAETTVTAAVAGFFFSAYPKRIKLGPRFLFLDDTNQMVYASPKTHKLQGIFFWSNKRK